MAEQELVINRVHSLSTSTAGRAVSQVRDQELLIDEPTHLGGPGERMSPADAFLSGVSACGVLLVQGKAKETGVRLDKVEVGLEAVRKKSDTSVFQSIEMRFRLTGPSRQQAVQLVEHYKTH